MPTPDFKMAAPCLMDSATYRRWRSAKLESYPRNVEELLVEVGGLQRLGRAEQKAIRVLIGRANMAIYRCRDDYSDRAAVRRFAASFGLHRPDHHLCANADGVAELAVATSGPRAGYVPYSNRSLSWHTDGYYNRPGRQVRAVVLHCASAAVAGGENALLDPELAYIRLRDENPRFVHALAHRECMTIPANSDASGVIRPEVRGPVFSVDRNGALLMRYSARKKNIRWRDDGVTGAARACLAEFLADAHGPVLSYRLQAGEGLISNNVLHNRTAFRDGAGQQRLFYRARFFDRIGSSYRDVP